MFYFYVIGRALVLILPRAVSYFLATFLSRLQFYFSKKDRDVLIYNLSPVISDPRRIRQCAKKVFENFALYLADFLRFSKVNRNFMERFVKVSGQERVDEAIAKKRGIIFLGAHIGNYELAAAITSLLNCEVYVVALPHKDKRVNKFFNRQRSICKVKVIPTGIAVRKCFKLLGEGGAIGFLGDREFSSGGGIRMKLFSKTAILPNGPFVFSFKTNAVVIPSFFIRQNRDYFHFIFEEPITSQSDTEEAAVGEMMQKYAVILERYIRQYPEQWYLFQKYWLEEHTNEDLGCNSGS